MSDTHTVGERNAEKLKARFKSRGQDVPQGFQKYAQERLACRLQAFEEGRNLVVTGGCLYHWCPTMSDMDRPTSDIDLHTYEVRSHEDILDLFNRAVTVEDSDDFRFEVGKVSELEHEHSEYRGLRMHIVGWLGKLRVNTYADISIGGEPPIGLRELPIVPMIEGQTSATIKAQPWEYSIAEKLHGIVTRGLTNSRMKDYRDLVLLSRKGFDPEKVRAAIAHTFDQCRTVIPAGTPEGLMPVFSSAKQSEWSRHLEKHRVTGMPQDLDVVVTELRAYFDDKLTPAYAPSYH